MPKKLIKPNIDIRVYIPEDLYIQYRLIERETNMPKGFFSQWISSVLLDKVKDFEVKCKEVQSIRQGLLNKKEKINADPELDLN